MLLAQRNSVSPFSTMANYLDYFFSPQCTTLEQPKVNIVEHEGQFELQLALPGMRKEDFQIDLQEDTLTIRGEQRQECDCPSEAKGEYLRREFGLYSFSRSFSLPDTVDTEGVKASYTDGVLRVELPKREVAPEQGRRAIAVE